uniref:Short salivary lipocalin n=1 Tax=Triatoma matogrossensis TaxID=162370 RepID=E2J761_9HEMI
MKTIVAVIFLGLLAFVFADSPPFQKCNLPSPLLYFCQKKFLTRNWYVTQPEHDLRLCCLYTIQRHNSLIIHISLLLTEITTLSVTQPTFHSCVTSCQLLLFYIYYHFSAPIPTKTPFLTVSILTCCYFS